VERTVYARRLAFRLLRAALGAATAEDLAEKPDPFEAE